MRAVGHCIAHIRHAMHMRFNMQIIYAEMYSIKFLKYLN
jgi:hypothetical protein